MLRVVEHYERTDTGRQRRENEDAYYARAPLFAVADGMGGAQAGEVASRLAVTVIERGLPEGAGSVEERLSARVAEANVQINELAASDDARAGMGTTLTVAHVGADELTVAHVGDSRLYRLRDGSLERLTDDHSLVEELVREGRITPEEAEEHPQRSIITRALGIEVGLRPDSRTWPARAGDRYLICSDGLTSMVAEPEVAAMLTRSPTLEIAGRSLIEAANAAGGRDNITVVLFRVEDVEGPQDAAGELTAEHDAVAREPVAPAPTPTAPSADPGDATATHPVAPRSARAAPAKRRRRVPGALVAAIVMLVIIAVAGWFASQTVYFVGTSGDGFVTVYRGVPYDLPAGLDLYSVNYESGVPFDELSASQRATVLGHELRAKDDAQDLVRKLEQGKVAAQ